MIHMLMMLTMVARLVISGIFHFRGQPLEHRIVVAEVGARTGGDDAAGERIAVWLAGSLDSDASAVDGMEPNERNGEKRFIQFHTALVVTGKISKRPLCYSNWQLASMTLFSIVTLIMGMTLHYVIVTGVVLFGVIMVVAMMGRALHNVIVTGVVMVGIIMVVAMMGRALHWLSAPMAASFALPVVLGQIERASGCSA